LNGSGKFEIDYYSKAHFYNEELLQSITGGIICLASYLANNGKARINTQLIQKLEFFLFKVMLFKKV
jgi:hypothetical protein